MPLQIRRLDHSDGALLRELRIAALQDSPREFGETLDEALSRSDQGWIDLAPSAYLAELEGRSVGMAFAFDDRWDRGTARFGGCGLRRAFVGRVSVLPCSKQLCLGRPRRVSAACG